MMKCVDPDKLPQDCQPYKWPPERFYPVSNNMENTKIQVISVENGHLVHKSWNLRKALTKAKLFLCDA